MEDSKAAVTSAHSDFPSLLSTPPPRRRSPTPASYRDSCLSLINAWHLVQRERGDMGGRGVGVGSSEWVRHIGRDGEKQKKKAAWIQEMGGFWQRSPPTRREGWELEDEVSLWPRFQDTQPEEAETYPMWTPSPSHAHPSTSVKTITEERGPVWGRFHPVVRRLRTPCCCSSAAVCSAAPLTPGHSWKGNLGNAGAVWINFCFGADSSWILDPIICWDDSRELPGGMTAEHLRTIRAATSPSKWVSDESPIAFF